jgi:hypothetical protein
LNFGNVIVILPDVKGVVDLNKSFIIIVFDEVMNFTALLILTFIPFKYADVTGC